MSVPSEQLAKEIGKQFCVSHNWGDATFYSGKTALNFDDDDNREHHRIPPQVSQNAVQSLGYQGREADVLVIYPSDFVKFVMLIDKDGVLFVNSTGKRIVEKWEAIDFLGLSAAGLEINSNIFPLEDVSEEFWNLPCALSSIVEKATGTKMVLGKGLPPKQYGWHQCDRTGRLTQLWAVAVWRGVVDAISDAEEFLPSSVRRCIKRDLADYTISTKIEWTTLRCHRFSSMLEPLIKKLKDKEEKEFRSMSTPLGFIARFARAMAYEYFTGNEYTFRTETYLSKLSYCKERLDRFAWELENLRDWYHFIKGERQVS